MRTRATRFTVGTAVRLASLATVLTLMSGCAGVLPLPVTSNKPESGHKIERAQAAFIQPGLTTRNQVIDLLGSDYTALPMNRALAYTWELPGGGGIWWYSIFLGYGGAADGGNWAGGWRGFFVAFDDQDVVTASKFKKLSCRRAIAPANGSLGGQAAANRVTRYCSRLCGRPGPHLR